MPSVEAANVGKAVATRVGANIREVRAKLGMTQAQLAFPAFSISYISAIERGKIRPSLRALSILAHHLNVPIAFLLEGSPIGAAEARAMGYVGPVQQIDLDLLLAKGFIQQGAYKQAEEILSASEPNAGTVKLSYNIYLIRGKVYMLMQEHEKAIADLHVAVEEGAKLSTAYRDRALKWLKKAIDQYALGLLVYHLRCIQNSWSKLITALYLILAYGNKCIRCFFALIAKEKHHPTNKHKFIYTIGAVPRVGNQLKFDC